MVQPNSLSRLPGEVRNAIWRHIEDILLSTPIEIETVHQPAASFTCKAFRNEVLSIFYGENTWYLGKIGYHDPTHIRLWDFNKRLARWKAMLGPYTRYLSNLSMSIDGRCYAWDGMRPGNAEYEMKILCEGKLLFTMNGELRCTCRLKEGVEWKASRDGGVLLEVMKEYGASYCEAVCEGTCGKCYRSRLEKFGSTEVTHLPLWGDIEER